TEAAHAAGGLTADLMQLLQQEIKAPEARAKSILDGAHQLDQQLAAGQAAASTAVLANAARTLNNLTFDLVQLLENEITAPAERVKGVFDRTRELNQKFEASGGLPADLRRNSAAALRASVDLLLKSNDSDGAFDAAEAADKVLQNLVAGA